MADKEATFKHHIEQQRKLREAVQAMRQESKTFGWPVLGGK